MPIADSLVAEIAQLPKMTVGQMRGRYGKLFPQAFRIPHKQHLVRRIAWNLQAASQGDIPEKALARAMELASTFELKQGVTYTTPPPPRMRKPPRRTADDRLPGPGTVLTRLYQGRNISVTVLADGYIYDGRPYNSLSAVARAVTGTRWNGLLFFGIAKRDKAATGGKARRAA